VEILPGGAAHLSPACAMGWSHQHSRRPGAGARCAHPGIVRGAIFPYDDLTNDELQADIDAIADLDLIVLYRDDDGVPLYQIVKWWQYQRPTWAWPSDLPAPEGWTDREKYRKGNEVIEGNWEGEGGFIQSDGDKTVTPERPHDDPAARPAPSGSGSIRDRDSESGSNSTPPAVKVFRENAHRFPAKSWWDDVDERVGRDPPDLERWGHTVKEYVGQGWNPTNVSNMLTFFEEHRIPGAGKDNGQGEYNDFDFG